MKYRKKMFISAVLLMAVFSAMCVFSFGCTYKVGEVPKVGTAHEHNYEVGEWTWSEDCATCTAGLTCTSDTGTCSARDGGMVSADVTSETTYATCTEDGKTVYTAKYEGEVVSTAEVVIPAAGHTYTAESEVTWSWVWDDESGYGVTAAVACDVCGATAEASVTVEGPSDGLYGEYTATATMGGQVYTDTAGKSADVPEPYVSDVKIEPESLELAIGESGVATGEIVVTVTMSDESIYSGQLTIECVAGLEMTQTNDGEGKVSLTVTASEALDKTSVTVEAGGVTATFTVIVKAYEAPESHTHTYGDPVWEWDETNYTCTVTLTCTEEGCAVEGYQITEDAAVSSVTTGATCVTDGKVVYTATYTAPDGTVYTCAETKTVITATATGHSYGGPVWTWNGDYTSATATFTCTNDYCQDEDGQKVIEAAATVEQSDYTAPSCTAEGSCKYTATVDFGEMTYTDVKDVTLSATGHSYPASDAAEGVSWTWSTDDAGNITATAAVTCSVCGDTETIIAYVCEDRDAYIAPGCVATGSRTYVAEASVESGGTTYTYTSTNPVALDATGHTEKVYESGKKYATYRRVAAVGDDAGCSWCVQCVSCGDWYEMDTPDIYGYVFVACDAAEDGTEGWSALNAAFDLKAAEEEENKGAESDEKGTMCILVYGTVCIPSDACLAISCSNVEIYGLGTDKSVIVDSAFDGQADSTSVATSGIEISGINVTIRNLTICGDALNDVNDSHIYRHALEIKGGAKNVTISDCVITGGGVGDSDASVCIMEATESVKIVNCALSGAENGLVIEHGGDAIEITVSGSFIDAERAIWVDGGRGVTLKVTSTKIYGRNSFGEEPTEINFTNCSLGYHVSDGGLAYGAINAYCDITLDTCTFLSHDEGTNLYDALLFSSGNYAIDIRKEGITVNLYGCSFENTYGTVEKETTEVTKDNLIYLISSRSEEDSVILFEKDGLKYTCRIGEKIVEHIHNWDGGKVTKEATETETGEMTYTCVDKDGEKGCGETRTETIPRTVDHVTGVTLDKDYVIVPAGTSGILSGIGDVPTFTVNLSESGSVSISDYISAHSGDVTWSSDNEEVATVDSTTGAVTLTGVSGVTYITVSFAMDHVTASYVIAVAEEIGDDDPILGTWTGTDEVSATAIGITLNLKVEVTVTVDKNGFTLSVTDETFDIKDMVVWENAAWYKIDGYYYVAADDGTIIPIGYDEQNEELTTTFEFTFKYLFVNVTVAVENATLEK